MIAKPASKTVGETVLLVDSDENQGRSTLRVVFLQHEESNDPFRENNLLSVVERNERNIGIYGRKKQTKARIMVEFIRKK